MALVVADRVQETTSTTSTSSYVLLGAAAGYQSFGAVLANGDTTYYAITNDTDWEIGVGTYSTTGPTLARTTILASSSGGSAVNWGVGVKNIFISYAASKSVYQDETGAVLVADKIVHTGDTDTAIRFPAANTVSVETGGAERFKVENSTITTTVPIALPANPTLALQATTKQYVDAVAQRLNVHVACDSATTASIASLTGGTVTYNNGYSGVGATLTLSVALTTLDGVTLTNGMRLLIKNEVATANNGIYTWATGGTVLTRATDFDTNVEIAAGDFTFVTYGTSYASTGWVQTLPVTTVGTSPIVWAQFSGSGSYTAGNGLQLVGSQFSLISPVTVANGGTGQTSASAAFNALSPITTTGDLIVGNGTNSATRLGIGSSGFVLKSTGTTAAWQLNPTYLPVVLHDASSTNISVASGYLPVLLHDGVTTVNVALF